MSSVEAVPGTSTTALFSAVGSPNAANVLKMLSRPIIAI